MATTTKPRESGLLPALSIVDSVIAVLAVWSGLSMVSTTPGIALLAVGAAMGIATAAGWRNTRHAPIASLAAALLGQVWVVTGLLVGGPWSLLQAVIAVLGLAVILLAGGVAAQRRGW